ncbi:hypothetical protein HO133_000052 [Letharia lupina]|uniref:Uncharacterized protein n=1 Tax=Letharia lupina TaxID=560253 RepID=A0A8H6CH11_9LECA|nr:uncharacterized protein HO133_000052 [Letharia lupina]KAF6223210.1 hypothetical protein HO133_000052 [Letharia lupina]
MISVSGSPMCLAVLSCCLLLSFLNSAVAFAAPNPGSNITVSRVYQTRGSSSSVSSLTHVQSLKASSVSGNNVVTVNTPAHLVDSANATLRLANYTAATPSLEPISLASSRAKVNKTGPETVTYVTKAKVQFPANTTRSAIVQTLVSQSLNATSPVIVLSTAYTTIFHTLKTVVSIATSSEYQSANSSTAGLTRYLSSLSSMPPGLELTSEHNPTSATMALSSGSVMTYPTTGLLNGTLSAFSWATQVLTSTSSRPMTTVGKVLSSESRKGNATVVRSVCISCASSSFMTSTVISASGAASTTKSIPLRIHASSTPKRTERSSISSSGALSTQTATSQNQTNDATSISPSGTTLSRSRSSSSHRTKTTSVKSLNRSLRSSSKFSRFSSEPVTTRTQPVKVTSSTTNNPTTTQTVSAGNDTILVLPLAAVVRPSSTQSTGSTSAAIPTALPPADPAQHARHVAKLAEILAPSIVGGTGLSITVQWAIWNFLKKKAVSEGKAGVEVVEEQSAVVQTLTRVSSVSRLSEDTVWPGDIGADLDRAADIENSILQEEAVNPGILTNVQVAQIEDAVTAPPPPPGPLPGEDTAIEDPPSTGDPPTVGPPKFGPFEIKPPKYDDPESVQFADTLPPMGRPVKVPVMGVVLDYPVRIVPQGYSLLSFDAKIFYASKYGENVWSRTLVYDNGRPAAVGPDNKPLKLPQDLKLDSAGNVVSYKGLTVKDLETFGFPKDGTWRAQQAKLDEIKKLLYRYEKKIKVDRAEQERIKQEQEEYKHQKHMARIKKMEEGLEKVRKTKEDRKEAEKEAKDEADQKAKEEADRKAKEEADRKAKEEAGRKAKEEAEADRKAKEDSDRKSKEEADRKAKEESDRKAKEESDRRAKEEANRKAEEEEKRKAEEEADQKAKEEKDKETDDRDDPNTGKWKHKSYCGSSTPPSQHLTC